MIVNLSIFFAIITYKMHDTNELFELLRSRAKSGDRTVLRSAELKSLYDELKVLPPEQRAQRGKEINQLRNELTVLLGSEKMVDGRTPIDVTAPWDVNTSITTRPQLLPSEQGTMHPLTQEIERIIEIFVRMGFSAVESRQIDNDFNMFTALNFPEGHPARDDYDTFVTEEGLVAPAHTSTMQNRILSQNKALLEKGEAIAMVIPGRVFRNEDLDATHEHTFHQVEG